MGVKINMLNQRFGRLVVIDEAPNYRTQAMWKCKCDCGNIVICRGSHLRDGVTNSCGCLLREKLKEISKKFNTYNLEQEYGIGYTLKNEIFYFDKEDYEKIKRYCWYKNRAGYLIARNENGKQIRMHRLIMDCLDSNLVVDHINRITYDNRKSNLRLCTQALNTANSKKPKNSTNTYIGVTFNKDLKKWSAKIMVNRKPINLGYFNTEQEALMARLKGEKLYWGDYAPQRYLFYLLEEGI